MTPTDEALVRRAQRGDRKAFAALVTAHHARVIATARALVGNPEAAEDVSQEAFVEAWRSLPRLEQPTRFRAWLYAILRHRALNHLRAERREPDLTWAEDAGDEPAAEPPSDDFAEVRATLDQLPERDREVLAARYLQEMSYEEIAEGLGLTVNAVRVRCHRAKDRLRELLGAAPACAAAEGGAR